MSLRSPWLVACLLSLPIGLEAQAGASARLLRPAGPAFPEPFSLPRSIRELADGRVLMIDWLEQKVLALDWTRRTSRQIGRLGSGPAEYRLPSRLFPLGDTTVVRDLGNDRMLLIAPDLRIVGSFRGPSDAGYPVAPVAADRAGWLYFEIPGWAVRAPPGDSTTLARWNRKTGRIEKLGRIRGWTQRPSTREPGIPMVMFAPEDGWTVADDGRLLLVRSGDYSVETRQPDGSVVRGPAQAYPTRRVNDQDRKSMVRRFLASSPMSGRGPGGGMGLPPASMQSEQEVARITRTSYYAETLPYFSPAGVWISPTGELWVRRTSGADEPIQLDRFDAHGAIRERVQLPDGRTPLAVGRSVVYAAVVDDDGLQRLERYSY